MSASRLKDVAKSADVSVATASLALSGKGRISETVRERVRHAADQLGYAAVHASRFRPTSAVAVGILHAADRDYEWSFIRPTLLELERAMLQHDLLPVFIPVDGGMSAAQTSQLIGGTGASALFSIQIVDEAVFTELQARGIQVVVVNNSGFQDRFHSVCVDDFQGAYEGALFLLSLGHRTIAFVEYERPDIPTVVADRFIGFRKALEERRVGFSPERRITIPFLDVKKLEKRLGSLFTRPEKPTAIFAHDDYLGLFIVEALQRMGLDVPRDVSLIAPGDVLDYRLPGMRQLTTMRIDTSLLGRVAANLLLERMTNTDKEVHVLKVKEQLVRRQSCRQIGEGKK